MAGKGKITGVRALGGTGHNVIEFEYEGELFKTYTTPGKENIGEVMMRGVESTRKNRQRDIIAAKELEELKELVGQEFEIISGAVPILEAIPVPEPPEAQAVCAVCIEKV